MYSDSAIAIVEDLEIGTWYLHVDAYNSDAIVIYTGSAYVGVQSSVITPVSLVMNPTTGGISITVIWNESGEISPIGKYLQLNGEGNGYVFIGNYPALQLTNNFTLELLVCAQSTFRRAFLAKSSDRFHINYYLASGSWNQPCFQIKNGIDPVTAQDTSYYLVAGQWTHLAGVFEGNVMRLYVNGELIGTTETSIVPDTSGNLYIGWPGDDYYWLSECCGMIDEVRIWNIVRTQDEIKGYMSQSIPSASRSGLVGYWNFENLTLESDGTTLINDLSGNGFNGILVGDASIEGN